MAARFLPHFLLFLLLFARTSLAWVESRITTTLAAVDVEPNGTATVSQELTLHVRGGPLKHLELDGIDLDADVLPGASVVPADIPGAYPLPLLLSKGDDGHLTLEVDGKKGVRSGSFLFRFRYKTDLLGRGLIRQRGSNALVTWVGPRISDGVDSARVIFRLPPDPEAPTLPPLESLELNPEGFSGDGAFISGHHKMADKDEVELVRPHVARGEPVLWRILTRARVFPVLAGPTRERGVLKALSAPRTLAPEVPIGPWAFGLLAAALGYALLVFFKAKGLSARAAACNAAATSLVPLGAALRAAIAGLMLAFGLLLVFYFDEPTWAALCVVAAGLLAVERLIPAAPAPRGPGQWLALRADEAFSRKIRPEQCWFDLGTARGRLVLCSVAASWFLAAAFWSVERSLYEAVVFALGSVVLLPIVQSGRPSALWNSPFLLQARALGPLFARLQRIKAAKIVPFARVAEGQVEPDELRLLVKPKHAEVGLISLEMGFDARFTNGGPLLLPYVLLRVREDSPCFERLPRGFLWTRGRKPDERVAIVYPKLLTARSCLELLKSLLTDVTLAKPPTEATPRGRARRAPELELAL